MADEKQPAHLTSYTSNDSSPTTETADTLDETPYAGDGDGANSPPLPNPSSGSLLGQHAPDSEGEGRSASSQSSDEKDEYILVKLEDVSKEIQCPLCLGIIRKTRTVMECMHRFCRECINKAMRIGKNECPACRTHCASRRSLRDDPNFDALIAALYPHVDFDALIGALYSDDDEYDEKIQAPVAKTFKRRSEALGQRRSTPEATAAAFMRRSQRIYRSGKNSYYRRRGRAAAHNVSPLLSDYDEEEDDAIKGSSSSEEPSPDRVHKRGRIVVPTSSPASLDLGFENYDTEMNIEIFHTSPLRAGNKELSWGRGGVRSQTRHGNSSGSNGRFVRAARLTRLIEYLHNLDENEHKFIAIQTSGQVEGFDVFVRKSQPSNQVEKVQSDGSAEMQILGAEESLAGLLTSFASSQGDLELLYRTNVGKDI